MAVFRANLVRQGQLEIEAIQAHLDHQVSMVYQELLERRVPRSVVFIIMSGS